MKQKDLNYYVGKKGYTDVIQLPVPGAQPQRYALDILESYENILYAKAYNNVNNHSEWHVYTVNDNNELNRIREGIYYDKDELGKETILRFVGRPEEVKALYNTYVEARKVTNAATIAKQQQLEAQAEADKAKAKETERIKLLQNTRIDLRDDIVKELSKLTADRSLTKVLGDKKVKVAVDNIVMIDKLHEIGLIL